MSERDALRKEVDQLPDTMVGQVIDFVRHLKSRQMPDAEFWRAVEDSYGCMPDLVRPPQGDMPPAKNIG